MAKDRQVRDFGHRPRPLRSGYLALAFLIWTIGCLSTLVAQSPRRTLRLTESLHISAMDHDLSLVGLVTRGPDGTIWLTQPQDGNIVAFTPSGKKLRVIGRRGEGPGEFSLPDGLRADSSGLRVFDVTLRRVTHFTTQGSLLATTRVEVPPTVGTRVSPQSVGVEWVGYLMFEPPGSGESPERSEATLYVADLLGGDLRRIVGFSHINCAAVKRSGNSSIAVAVPFCHREELGFSPNGKFIALALPTAVRGGETGFTLSVRTNDGTAVASSRHDLGPSSIPRRSVDSAVARLRDRERDRHSDLADAIITAGRIPRSFPPIRSIAVSDSGTVWVTTRSGPTGEFGVLVIRQDGTEVGYAPVPANVFLTGWVSERQALALLETPDGLYDVVLYAIGPE